MEEIVVPILPLKETHIYPKIVMPVIVGFPETLEAVEAAVMNFQGRILCLMQKPSFKGKYPEENNLYTKGFLCKITQLIKMPDKKVRVLLKGEAKFEQDTNFFIWHF